MRQINLNNVTKYSPWIARLLSLEPFERQTRDLTKIEWEYNNEKYARLLDYYNKNKSATVMDIKSREIQISWSRELCVSKRASLFLTTQNECLQAQNTILVDALSEALKDAKTVVELGCGYGYNLAVLKKQWPSLTYTGGECSANAIELGNILFGENRNVSINHFNFYDHEWSIFDGIQGPIVVFTRHAIEQLPRVRDFLPAITKYRDKIKDVIHLEPIYEMHDGTVLGLLRRAYAHINDYNIDLLTTIKEMDTTIRQKNYDVYGSNPLNPTSLVRWQFNGRRKMVSSV